MVDIVMPILLFAVPISGYIWWRTHCPNCYQPFAKRLVSKDKRSLGQHFQGKQTRNFECKKCDHTWTKEVYIDA